MLSIKNISKSFGDIQALDNVSFSIKKGELVTLYGANGAGKSTLIKIICGIIDADSGSVDIFGANTQKNRAQAIANIGYMPENTPLYQDLSVMEFLFFMAKIKKTTTQGLLDIVKKLSLQNVINQKIETLSKGYKSRVAIAQALIGNPKVLVLDEPTHGLDPNQKQHLREILKEYAKDNIVLISTHIIEEAKELNSKILVLNNGKLVANKDIKEAQSSASFSNALRRIMENKS